MSDTSALKRSASAAEVNPQMVTLARQARGLTQAELADLMEKSQGTVSKFEAGAPVSDDELATMADVLDFPPHFFVQQWRLDGPAASELYHRKRQRASAATLYEVYAKATIRREQVKALLRSADGTDLDFPLLPIDQFEGKPDKIARTVRAMLQVPMGPIYNMTRIIEEAGGIVIESDFGTRDIDGFSRRPQDSPPLFFINRELPPDRWRWTLAHELGHVAMHPGSIPHTEMEDEADAFAGEFLAPAHEIKPQLVGMMTISKLAGLKRHWKISIQALIQRAYRLNVITDRQRRYMFVQMSQAGYRLREPQELDPKPEPPQRVRELVRYHKEKLGYSEDDLRSLLAINETDMRRWYFSDAGSHLRLVTL